MYTKKCVVFKICLHALKYKKLYINPNLGGLLEGCFEVVVVVVVGGWGGGGNLSKTCWNYGRNLET